MASYVDKITTSDGTTYNITGVFIAKYGMTTFSELTEAFANKRLILAYVSGSPQSYYALTSAGTFYEFRKFSVDLSNNITTYYMDTITCNSSGWDSYRTSISGTTNAGIIQMYAGAATQTITDGIATVTGAPNGWLICDGSELLKSEYPELAAALSNTWGTPSSSDYFKLPDLRGRAPIGAGTGSGLTARALGAQNIGAETVKLTAAQSGVPAHNHAASATSSRYFLVSPDTESADSAAALSGSGYYFPRSKTTGWQHNANTQNNTAANASSAHTNMQPSAVVNFIICTGKAS